MARPTRLFVGIVTVALLVSASAVAAVDGADDPSAPYNPATDGWADYDVHGPEDEVLTTSLGQMPPPRTAATVQSAAEPIAVPIVPAAAGAGGGAATVGYGGALAAGSYGGAPSVADAAASAIGAVAGAAAQPTGDTQAILNQLASGAAAAGAAGPPPGPQPGPEEQQGTSPIGAGVGRRLAAAQQAAPAAAAAFDAPRSKPGEFMGGPTLEPQHGGYKADNPKYDIVQELTSARQQSGAAADGLLDPNLVKSLNNDMMFAVKYGNQGQGKKPLRRRLVESASGPVGPAAGAKSSPPTPPVTEIDPEAFGLSAKQKEEQEKQQAALEQLLFGQPLGLADGPAKVDAAAVVTAAAMVAPPAGNAAANNAASNNKGAQSQAVPLPSQLAAQAAATAAADEAAARTRRFIETPEGAKLQADAVAAMAAVNAAKHAKNAKNAAAAAAAAPAAAAVVAPNAAAAQQKGRRLAAEPPVQDGTVCDEGAAAYHGRPLYGVTYSWRRPGSCDPANRTCRCPDPSDVEQDLDLIHRYAVRFRTFSVECPDALQMLAHFTSASPEFSWAVGIWVGTNPEAVTAQIELLERALEVTPGARLSSIIVGSEAVWRGDVSQEELVGYMTQVRDMLLRVAKATSVTRIAAIPITTAEPPFAWTERLVAASDVIAYTLHPYYAGEVDTSTVGWAEPVVEASLLHHQILAARYPGKPTFVAEVGWPTGAGPEDENGSSKEAAAAFIKAWTEVAKAKGIPYYYHELADATWKAPLRASVTVSEASSPTAAAAAAGAASSAAVAASEAAVPADERFGLVSGDRGTNKGLLPLLVPGAAASANAAAAAAAAAPAA